MVDTVIALVTPTRAQDENGIWHNTGETSREVFARMDSISRAEFFAAGQAGFKPDYKFVVFAGEYAGEALCDYNGVRYAIYRTYQVPGTDYMELYVHQKAGVSVGERKIENNA